MVEPGEHRGFAVELVAGLLPGALGQAGVVHDFLDRAQAADQALVFGEEDAAHAALSDDAHDRITSAQDVAGFQGREHDLLIVTNPGVGTPIGGKNQEGHPLSAGWSRMLFSRP